MDYQYLKKKSITKLVSILVVAVLLLAACGGNSSAQTDKKTFKIGILQLIDHGSLDAAREGFVERIKELEKEKGITVEIDIQNAQGDQANLKSMSEKLVKGNDLVFAIATPAAQAVLNETTTLPIVFTAVTDPIDAGLVSALKQPGGNITGTTDNIDVSKQIELILKVKPDVKKVGLIYNAGEANSQQQIKDAKKALAEKNIETVEKTVTTTNDTQTAMESLAKQVEAIYIPTDNTLASAMATVGAIAKENKIPVIPGSGEMALEGGLATYGVDYQERGTKAANIAVEILVDGKNAGSFDIAQPTDLELVINEDMAKALGIDMSSLQ